MKLKIIFSYTLLVIWNSNNPSAARTTADVQKMFYIMLLLPGDYHLPD